MVKIYNLGDLTSTDEERIPILLLAKLKKVGKYEPTHIYRALVTDDDSLRRIKKEGTDRSVSGQKEQIRKFLADVHGEDNIEEALEIAKDYTDPSIIFAAREKGLQYIISIHASPWVQKEIQMRATHETPRVHETPKVFGELQKFSLVLVYRGDCLVEESEESFRFKKGIKPLDALVAGIRFLFE